MFRKSFFLLWAQQDSNLRPADYEFQQESQNATITDRYGLL